METRAKHVAVGAFVILLSAAMLMSVLWAGKLSLEREYDHYDVYFREAVTGLSKGSPVQYSGIQVGDVTALRLSRVDPGRVIARIRIAGGTPVKEDTQAKLGYLGLTGVAFIQLSGGSAEAPRLLPRDGREVAVIRAQPSDLARLFESGADIVVTVNDVLERVAAILSDENAERLATAIADFGRITAAVGAETDSIQGILRDGARASQELTSTLEGIRATVARLESTVGTADRLLSEDVSEAMAALRQASQDIQGILGDNRGAIDQFAQEGLVELGQVLTELRTLLISVQSLSRRLESDPSGFLLGRDQPREYRPR
ncbi:MAG: MCE family protein [Xanthomonadales bacterium]|nr:MCE family protein [Xanthomonadales bacterium]